MTDERLTPEQGLVAQAVGIGTELALLEDRELARRIMRDVAAAWDEGVRKGAAARAALVEPEPEPGTVFATNIRAIGPAEIRARRWAE